MKKSAFSGGDEGSPRAKKSNLSPGTRICIEREKIVHIHCSDFRQVVHELTGAEACNNEDRVLLPASGTHVNGSRHDSPVRSDGIARDPISNVVKGHETQPKNDPPAKAPEVVGSKGPVLFERRRSNKSFGRLSTSCKDLPSLEHTPFTPLASEFEKIRLPHTPTGSPDNLNLVKRQEQNGMPLHPSPNQKENADIQMSSSSQDQPMMDISLSIAQPETSILNRCFASDQPLGLSVNQPRISSSVSHLQYSVVPMETDIDHSEPSAEEVAIAEKGFFLHAERLRNSELKLLPLFPETPRDP